MNKRVFKRITEDQAAELADEIKNRLNEGTGILEALRLIQAYACIEELLCIRAQVNEAIEKLEEIRKLEGPIAPEYLMEIIEVLQGNGI